MLTVVTSSVIGFTGAVVAAIVVSDTVVSAAVALTAAVVPADD